MEFCIPSRMHNSSILDDFIVEEKFDALWRHYTTTGAKF